MAVVSPGAGAGVRAAQRRGKAEGRRAKRVIASGGGAHAH